MTGAVLFLGTADTVSRLAVLRHSDTLTAASLDAGLMPLATLMARACGASFGLGATLPTEALALVVLLFSFLVQHQLAWRNSEVSSLDSLTRAPVLLGRAVYGPEGRRKLRDV